MAGPCARGFRGALAHRLVGELGPGADYDRIDAAGNRGEIVVGLVALYHGCGLLIAELNHARKQRVIPLPAKAISVGYHPPTKTALLSTQDQRVYLVDTVAGKVVRSFPARLDPDPTAVVSLDA